MKKPSAPRPPTPLPVVESSGREIEEVTLQANGDNDEILPPSTVFQIQHGVVSSLIDDELIVGDLLQNKYFRMNWTGAFIWRCLERPSCFSQVVDEICSTYEVDRANAEQFASEYIRGALSAGIISSSTHERRVWREET